MHADAKKKCIYSMYVCACRVSLYRSAFADLQGQSMWGVWGGTNGVRAASDTACAYRYMDAQWSPDLENNLLSSHTQRAPVMH